MSDISPVVGSSCGESWGETYNRRSAETGVDAETDFRQHVEDELEQCLEDIRKAACDHTLTTLAKKLETTARVCTELAAQCRRAAPDPDVTTPTSA